jgi:hypothetical protein
VAQRRLAGGALEQERLVGEVHRVAVQEVDLHLRGAGLVDQRVDLESCASQNAYMSSNSGSNSLTAAIE